PPPEAPKHTTSPSISSSPPQTTVTAAANSTQTPGASTNGSASVPSSQIQPAPIPPPPEAPKHTTSPSISSSPPQTTETTAANPSQTPSASTNGSTSVPSSHIQNAPVSNPSEEPKHTSSTSTSVSLPPVAGSAVANSTPLSSAPTNSSASPSFSLTPKNQRLRGGEDTNDDAPDLSPPSIGNNTVFSLHPNNEHNGQPAQTNHENPTANSSFPPQSSNGTPSLYTDEILLDKVDDSDSDDSDDDIDDSGSDAPDYESPPPSSHTPNPALNVQDNGSAPIPSSSAASSSSSSASPQQPPSAMEKVAGIITNYFTSARHFSKWKKYRLIQDRLEEFAHYRNVKPYQPSGDDTPTDREIAKSWNNLIKALLEPTQYTTADDQYRDTVDCLRNTYQMLVSATEGVKQKFVWQLRFVEELCDIRFEGIELFPYLRELVELASKTPLPGTLTLENFLQEFLRLAALLNNPDASHAMNVISCQFNKAKGSTGIAYDPLRTTSNIPYQDGKICINGRETTILWHGTPVSQHDPYGLMFNLATAALAYIPFMAKYLTNGNTVSSPPVVNADHIAFIEHAATVGKKIFHVILENGEKKHVGDESPRVKARLRLGLRYKNVFVMALRLDGKFFERHDEMHEKAETVQSLKKRLSDQLLMPLTKAEDLSTSKRLTESKLYTKNMEDQLAANGFYVPQKLRDESKLPEHMDKLLNEVQKIYFPGVSNIESVEQHQAFLILSYVHIMLFITIKCEIDIIEALCKDDKDRGNVIKTIFKLHVLYLTGKISHDTLLFVLVHALARPFILQKNAIIKSRRVLLEHVIPKITAAHKKNPNPKTFLLSEVAKITAYYRVAQPKGQTIYPSNAASKTIEEYLAFVEYHKPAPIPCNISIEELSRFGYPDGTRQHDLIQNTISAAARSMNIFVEKDLIKAPTGKQDAALNELLPHLASNCGIIGDPAWKISCLFQPALGHALKEPLSKIYDNQLLGISINLDEKSLNTPGCGMTLTNQDKKPNITFNGIYNITDRKKAVIARIKVTMTMADAQTGQAQFKCVKL
ncbi:MAG TPA: hypothetical protein VFU89_00915, partial [Rhabdochlamydiaceae bacterium]|nr:hypothetical protein [Rhabdochlamydiaceae bacterium]